MIQLLGRRSPSFLAAFSSAAQRTPPFFSSKLSVAVALSLLGSSQLANAAGTFTGPGGIEGRWAAEVNIGASMRTRDADPSIVFIGNGGTASSNTVDDGNLNYKKGDIVNSVAKIVGEVEIKKGNAGAFFRAKAYSDPTTKRDKVPHGSSANAYARDEPLRDNNVPNGSKFEDVQLLDAYGFANFKPFDKPLTVKFGNQVVTWGEALFILGGVNQYSNFDAAALRKPGAQLKEVFLPIPQLYANFQATDSLSLETFVQLNHEKVSVDACGTFFSPADLLNCGRSGSALNAGVLGLSAGGQNLFVDFTGYSDQQSLNGGGTPVIRNGDGTPVPLVSPIVGQLLPALQDINFRMDEANERRARDGGQAGVSARYYAGEIGTEFGFYAVNYHQRLPALSLITRPTQDPNSVFSGQGLGGQLGVTPLSYFFDFGKENIKVLGTSAATELGGFSVFGEVSYTKGYPVAYNTADFLKGTANGDGPLASFQARAQSAPQGTIIAGFKPLDKVQMQVSTVKLFPQVLGSSGLAVVGELGMQIWKGIGDPFTSERFGRSPAFGAADHQSYAAGGGCTLAVNPNPRNCAVDGFATKTAAGYRVLGVLTYPDVGYGITLKPRLFFAHDFKGTSADGVFLEDRMNLGIGLRAEIQSGSYFAETNYSRFSDKAYFDPLKDRDFLSLVLGANI